ncbi:MAG: hypothetical protein P8X74_07490 [Reinekea sp.]
MLPKNLNEPMGAPAIFEKQIEIKLLHPASTLESRIQVLFFLPGCDCGSSMFCLLMFFKNRRRTMGFTPIFGQQIGVYSLQTAPLWSHGFRLN